MVNFRFCNFTSVKKTKTNVMKKVQTAFELKRTNLNGLKTINGVKVSTLGLDVTNSSVSMYSVEKQGNIYFQAPFILEF